MRVSRRKEIRLRVLRRLRSTSTSPSSAKLREIASVKKKVLNHPLKRLAGSLSRPYSGLPSCTLPRGQVRPAGLGDSRSVGRAGEISSILIAEGFDVVVGEGDV